MILRAALSSDPLTIISFSKDDYPLLYVSLRELIGAKKDGIDASNYQSDVRQLVEMNRDVPRKIQSKAVNVSAGLGKFEIQCTTDAADISREMRYLGRDIQGLHAHALLYRFIN